LIGAGPDNQMYTLFMAHFTGGKTRYLIKKEAHTRTHTETQRGNSKVRVF